MSQPADSIKQDKPVGYVNFLLEKISAKDEHLGYLHDKLDINRRNRRFWRLIAVSELILLVAVVVLAGHAAMCAA
ncbi:MAG: hypothetical protein ACU836_14955 [Gammaproteobacteria bacterium]